MSLICIDKNFYINSKLINFICIDNTLLPTDGEPGYDTYKDKTVIKVNYADDKEYWCIVNKINAEKTLCRVVEHINLDREMDNGKEC